MSDTASRIEQFKKMAEADPTNELGHFSLGRAYLPIGSAFRRHAADTARAVDSASADGALARVGTPHYVIDLSRAPRSGPVARWLDATRLKRAESGYSITSLGRAFDAIVYVDSIGPSRPE